MWVKSRLGQPHDWNHLFPFLSSNDHISHRLHISRPNFLFTRNPHHMILSFGCEPYRWNNSSRKKLSSKAATQNKADLTSFHFQPASRPYRIIVCEEHVIKDRAPAPWSKFQCTTNLFWSGEISRVEANHQHAWVRNVVLTFVDYNYVLPITSSTQHSSFKCIIYILGLHVYINILFWHRHGVPCSDFA